MPSSIYRYSFETIVPAAEVESTLVLAWLAAAGLFGDARLRLEAAHLLDRTRRVCVIDARGPAGRAANRIFVALVTREFGPEAFRVECVDSNVLPGTNCRDRSAVSTGQDSAVDGVSIAPNGVKQ